MRTNCNSQRTYGVADVSETRQRKTLLILLSAPLVTIPILFTYLVLQTPQSLLSDVSAASIQGEEVSYINQINYTIAKIELMSEKTSQFGSEVLVSDFKITDVVSKTRQLQNELYEEKVGLAQLKVPPKFSAAHPYLVASIENMYNSNEFLISAFQKFENVNSGRLPMFSIVSFLGSDEPSLYAHYKIWLINQEEKLLIEDSRKLFGDSIKEASLANNNLNAFISQSGINFSDVKLTESAKSFGRSGGCAACGFTIDKINSNRTA